MKMKKQRQTGLPRFIVGALTAAGASAANGATVQITFANNYLADSANGGATNFNKDFTAGGDLFVGSPIFLFSANPFGGGAPLAVMAINSLSGFYAGALRNVSSSVYSAKVFGAVGGSDVGATVARRSGLLRYTFSDTRINNGLSTNGFLNVSVVASAAGLYVNLNRLIFDDANVAEPSGTISGAAYPEWEPVSAVPEASSSLALLALGAGGLLTRRRQKRAA